MEKVEKIFLKLIQTSEKYIYKSHTDLEKVEKKYFLISWKHGETRKIFVISWGK